MFKSIFVVVDKKSQSENNNPTTTNLRNFDIFLDPTNCTRKK